jgi:hypothetical protein
LTVSWRRAVLGLLRSVFLLGILAMLGGVATSFEPDGGTPAIELHRRQRLARTFLLGGGGTAILAAIGVYAVGSVDRRRA